MAHVPVSSSSHACRTLDPVTEQKIANTSSKNAAKLNILHDSADKNYTYKEIKSRHTIIVKHVEEKMVRLV
jgi:hypothetical protein